MVRPGPSSPGPQLGIAGAGRREAKVRRSFPGTSQPRSWCFGSSAQREGRHAETDLGIRVARTMRPSRKRCSRPALLRVFSIRAARPGTWSGNPPSRASAAVGMTLSLRPSRREHPRSIEEVSGGVLRRHGWRRSPAVPLAGGIVSAAQASHSRPLPSVPARRGGKAVDPIREDRRSSVAGFHAHGKDGIIVPLHDGLGFAEKKKKYRTRPSLRARNRWMMWSGPHEVA